MLNRQHSGWLLEWALKQVQPKQHNGVVGVEQGWWGGQCWRKGDSVSYSCQGHRHIAHD